MIRAISLFITILLLAGSASADLLHTTFVGEVWKDDPSGGRLQPAQESVFNFAFVDFLASNTRFRLTDPVDAGTRSFDFDTVQDCVLPDAGFVWSPFQPPVEPVPADCFDRAWTRYGFGNNADGFNVEFNHVLAGEGVETDGAVVFVVFEEDLVYSLEGTYRVQGDVSGYSFGVQLLELRSTRPPVPGDLWSEFEWITLVNELHTTNGAANFEFSLGDEPTCPTCEGGENRYTGILKKGTKYRLAFITHAWADLGVPGTVFPGGGVALVVPEPSSDLMGFAGILGLAILGRRRARAAKVS